jgi:hypothetical protein
VNSQTFSPVCNESQFLICLIVIGSPKPKYSVFKIFLQELIHSLTAAGPVTAKSELQPYFNHLVSDPKRMRTLLKFTIEYKQVIIYVFLFLMLIENKN